MSESWHRFLRLVCVKCGEPESDEKPLIGQGVWMFCDEACLKAFEARLRPHPDTQRGDRNER